MGGNQPVNPVVPLRILIVFEFILLSASKIPSPSQSLVDAPPVPETKYRLNDHIRAE
jgi:hypothetical protein